MIHFPVCPFSAKPIDLLAHYVGSEDTEDLSVEMQEPYNVLKVNKHLK